MPRATSHGRLQPGRVLDQHHGDHQRDQPGGTAGAGRRAAGGCAAAGAGVAALGLVVRLLEDAAPLLVGRGSGSASWSRAVMTPPRAARSSSAYSAESSSRYSGTVASSSAWVPTWVIVPPDSRATRSASSTVEARWATTMPVTPAQHPPQRLLDQRLGVDVERRQRVVEHQHARAAAAPPGPGPAAAADRRTGSCPARRSGCPGPRAGRRRTAACATSIACVDLGVAGVRPAEGEVLPGRHREQRRVLEGGRHDLPQPVQPQVADVDPVERDPAAGDVLEPRDQVGEDRSCPSRSRRPGRWSRPARGAG